MSVWLAVDADGGESKHYIEPSRHFDVWLSSSAEEFLDKGTIKNLIGRELTWDDEPVEYKGDEE